MAFTALLLTAITIADGGSSPSAPSDAALHVVRLDELVAEHWQAAAINPAEPSDDSTFLRRLTLDLLGRIPTCREAIAFAEDASPDKRQQLIRQLVDSPEFSLHFGN